MATADRLGFNEDDRRAHIAPLVMLIVFVLIAVVPWGLPNSARFILPMLPYTAIHYWTLNERGWMPAILVAVAGLFIDLVTHGPIGFWSIIYLLGHMCARWLSGPISDTRIGRYAGFILTVGLLAALQWVIASLYFVAWVDWRPFAIAGGVTLAFYPLLALLVFTTPEQKPLA